MEHFSPFASLAGGILIGSAAALLWAGSGRIAGISGIVGGIAEAFPADAAWRIAFLLGLVAAPLCYALLHGPVPQSIQAPPAALMVAGLLVGFGTRLGNGCTSGHGVCGIARLSPRSLAATALFMATAAIVVFVLRHLLGN
jgi:uncharacterized membrane protein YedE/YeeE